MNGVHFTNVLIDDVNQPTETYAQRMSLWTLLWDTFPPQLAAKICFFMSPSGSASIREAKQRMLNTNINVMESLEMGHYRSFHLKTTREHFTLIGKEEFNKIDSETSSQLDIIVLETMRTIDKDGLLLSTMATWHPLLKSQSDWERRSPDILHTHLGQQFIV